MMGDKPKQHNEAEYAKPSDPVRISGKFRYVCTTDFSAA